MNNDLEFIFLGTGASSSMPHLSCLTPSENKNERPCRACLASIDGTSEGRKNVRRNTSAAVRIVDRGGVRRTIVIDVGKDFRGAALEWFPKYGIRKIDAILLTHDHADAMNGLDDLRAWTQDGIIQDHIDVYLSEATFTVVKRAFPFLVSKELATGGGDVAAFRWHIIDYGVPFEVLDTGITITPLAVHHGWLQPRSLNKPYLCFGFNIQNTIIYISDGNHIPEETWALLEHSIPVSSSNIDSSSNTTTTHPNNYTTSSKSQNAPSTTMPVISSAPYPSTLTTLTPATKTQHNPYPVLILDCTHVIPYTAHFGIVQAVNVARRMGVQRTYVTDIGHFVAHDQWLAVGECLGGVRDGETVELRDRESRQELRDEEIGERKDVRVRLGESLRYARGCPEGEAEREVRKVLMGDLEEGVRGLREAGTVWMRPAHDGLRLVVRREGVVEDATYGV